MVVSATNYRFRHTRRWDQTDGFDALGNWDGVTTDADGGGGGSASTQTRTHNKQNQLTAVNGAAASPTYDANGNMTGDEVGRDLVYDGWNRIVEVKDAAAASIKTYAVDALGRRIASDPVVGATRDFYHSADWQVVEEREGTSAKVQYVWSPVYVDAMVLRDELGAGGGGGSGFVLDTGFDSDGKTTTAFSSAATGNDVALQSDGKYVVVGTSNGDAIVTRYNTDGTLDTTFDTDGKVTVNFGGTDAGWGIAIQPADGKIVIVGETSGNWAVVRLTTAGAMDNTFDGNGLLTTNFGSNADVAYAVTVQSDGKILVAGKGDNNNTCLARYNDDGSLDTSFDTDGKLISDLGTGDAAYALQLDGKIVVAGKASGDFVVARYNTNGSLDTTFDTDGKALINMGGSADVAYGLAIQPSDGKIILAGTNGSALLRRGLRGDRAGGRQDPRRGRVRGAQSRSSPTINASATTTGGRSSIITANL